MGTDQVLDIRPGGLGSNPDNLTNVGGTLYFSADDGINGRELWKSDGTAAGTVLVDDFRLGALGSDPRDLSVLNNTLYFTADIPDRNGDEIGRELWSLEENGGLTPLNTQINRFQSLIIPGTYLYAGEAESVSIRNNPNFVEEGPAFMVADRSGTDLIRINRFQSTITPGTYLYAGEAESQSIRLNFFDSFIEEGIAFYVYGAGSGLGTPFDRFQNLDRPGTYLYAGPGESANIIDNFPGFQLEGVAFEVGV